MGRSGPIRLLATAGATVLGGIFAFSMVSSIAVKVVQGLLQNEKKKTAPLCVLCKGQGFVKCRLCRGDSVIDWSPLLDPVVPRPCLCPTCDGHRVQRCLNCVGRGYV